jgi:hypothetical protein
VITVSNPIYYLYPILVVYGVGIGLDIGQLTNTVLASVPWQKAGAGSGINNTVRQVGSAFGVAIIGAVLVAVMASVGTADLNSSTIIPALIKPHLQTVLNNGLSGGLGATSFPSGSSAISNAITNVFDDALTQGTKWAAFTAGAFVSLGAIFSLFLSNAKQQWGGQEGGADSSSWAGQKQQGSSSLGNGKNQGSSSNWGGGSSGQQQWPQEQQQSGIAGSAAWAGGQHQGSTSSSGSNEQQKEQGSSSSWTGGEENQGSQSQNKAAQSSTSPSSRTKMKKDPDDQQKE